MALQRLAAVLLFAMPLAQAVIVDRVAIIVGNAIVKDSDIDEDLRATAFLNNENAVFNPTARKKAASRLIDQALIRKEIQSGEYPSAPVAEAQSLLADLKKRYPDEAAYQKTLSSRGIDEEEVKDRLLWQLTVLRFIDARFRPAALVTDEEIEKYYNQNQQQLRAANPGKPVTLEALRAQIQDTLTGERVNEFLDDWLNRRRQDTKIVYLEDTLK
jgi:peptidyl-prolyl cis-trans isomerase C